MTASLPTLTLSLRTESMMVAPSSTTVPEPIMEFTILASAATEQLSPIMTVPSSFAVKSILEP